MLFKPLKISAQIFTAILFFAGCNELPVDTCSKINDLHEKVAERRLRGASDGRSLASASRKSVFSDEDTHFAKSGLKATDGVKSWIMDHSASRASLPTLNRISLHWTELFAGYEQGRTDWVEQALVRLEDELGRAEKAVCSK